MKKIKESLEAAFNPDCDDKFDKLIIEIVGGRIILEEGKTPV